MNKDNLLALLVYAIDRDRLSAPVDVVLSEFLDNANGCKKIYTDPSDPLMYIEGLAEMDDIEFFTDYVLFYAKCHIVDGDASYGKLDKQIIEYSQRTARCCYIQGQPKTQNRVGN